MSQGPTGRRIKEPLADLIEWRADGQIVLLLVMHEDYRDDDALGAGLSSARRFLEMPAIDGIAPLAPEPTGPGVFCWETGAVRTARELIGVTAHDGGAGWRAAFEIFVGAGLALVSAAKASLNHGLGGHGALTPWRVAVSLGGNVVVLGYGIPALDVVDWIREQEDDLIPERDSLRFCPPERLAGDAEDARSDLFALALICVELATGKPVYGGSAADILEAVRAGEAHHRIQASEPPEPLVPILQGVLAPDRDHRTAPDDALAGLKQVLEDLPGDSLEDVLREADEYESDVEADLPSDWKLPAGVANTQATSPAEPAVDESALDGICEQIFSLAEQIATLTDTTGAWLDEAVSKLDLGVAELKAHVDTANAAADAMADAADTAEVDAKSAETIARLDEAESLLKRCKEGMASATESEQAVRAAIEQALAAEERLAEEAEQLAAEQAAKEEAERLAAEEAARKEAERLAAEEAARKEAERLAAEQAAKEEAERLAAEEAARKEAERLAAEEAARLEAERLAAEKAAKEEAKRLAAEAEKARVETVRADVSQWMTQIVSALELAVAHPGAMNPSSEAALAELTELTQQAQASEQAALATLIDAGNLPQLAERADTLAGQILETPIPPPVADPPPAAEPSGSDRIARLRRGRGDGEAGTTRDRLNRLRRRSSDVELPKDLDQPAPSPETEPTETPPAPPETPGVPMPTEVASDEPKPRRRRLRREERDEEGPVPSGRTRRLRRRAASYGADSTPAEPAEDSGPEDEDPTTVLQRLQAQPDGPDDNESDATQLLDRDAMKAALRASKSAEQFRSERVRRIRETAGADSPRERRRRRRLAAEEEALEQPSVPDSPMEQDAPPTQDHTVLFQRSVTPETEDIEEEPSDQTVLFRRPEGAGE